MASDTNTKKRQRAQRWGHLSEWVAALSLILKGYRILKMRYKTKAGEVDIIARKRDLVIMVEVKARRTVSEAVNSVTTTSQRRIEAAGDVWLSRQKNSHLLSVRYDIVAVRAWKWPAHFKDAF